MKKEELSSILGAGGDADDASGDDDHHDDAGDDHDDGGDQWCW